MITIITGVPGMGKTAMVVEMMLKEIEKGDRPFFVMGIPDLKLDHSPVPPVNEWTEERPDKDDSNVMLHYFTFPKNSIIIIDEAQRVMRPRASGSKVPPYIQAQETHRHTGVDFWLLTQKPSLLDQNIRELCGRHIHIKDTILGRKLFEWTEYMDVKSKANLDMAVKRNYSPPKKVFSLYKSAEAHTTQPRRFHQIWYVLMIALATFAYFGYKLYTGLYQRVQNKPPENIVKAIEKESKDINLQNAVYTPNKPTQTTVEQVKQEVLHPFMGYQFFITGTIVSKRLNRTYYEIRNESNSVFTNDLELQKLGYIINQVNDCSALLFFQGAQIVASCPKNESTSDSRQRAGGAVVSLSRDSNKQIDVPPMPLIDNSGLTPSPS